MTSDPGRLRVVVLRALGLGDLLAAVPALRALRTALPGAELTLIGPGDVGRLLRDAGLVDAVVPHHGLETLPPRVHGADVAVNLHGRGPQSHRLLRATRPGRMVAFAERSTRTDGPAWDEHEHERSRWVRLVADQLGGHADPDDTALDVALPAPPVADAVIVHPGAASPSRCWPLERWVEVVGALASEAEVVLTGTAHERETCVRLAAGAGLPATSVLAGTTDVRTLAALVARARLLLSSDTGVAHLAPAFGTPSVTLFGPTPPARWGPPSRGPHQVVWHGDAGHPGDPHGDRLDPALARIGVEEVLAAARRTCPGMAPAALGNGTT